MGLHLCLHGRYTFVAYMHTLIQIDMCRYLYIHLYVHTCTFMQMHKYIYIHVQLYISKCADTCFYQCKCAWYMYLSIHIYEITYIYQYMEYTRVHIDYIP